MRLTLHGLHARTSPSHHFAAAASRYVDPPAFVCKKTDRARAQFLGRTVISLVGSMIWFTTTAALAEGPPKFAGSQLEPIKWSELAGWRADDHLAAFAAYQASCRALLKLHRIDERGEISGALSNVCRKATQVQPHNTEAARVF